MPVVAVEPVVELADEEAVPVPVAEDADDPVADEEPEAVDPPDDADGSVEDDPPPDFGGIGPSTPDRSELIRFTTARLRLLLATISRPMSIRSKVMSSVAYRAASRITASILASRTSSSV
jgi:hypothetical protein